MNSLDMISIQGLNDSFLNQTKLKDSDNIISQIQSQNPDFSNNYNKFLIFPAMNISVISSTIKKPFKEPMIFEIYLKNIQSPGKICFGKLDVEENLWECNSDNFNVNEFYYHFNIFTDGIYAAMINPSTYQIQNKQNCFGLECHPLLIAGVVFSSFIVLIIIAYCIRVNYFHLIIL